MSNSKNISLLLKKIDLLLKLTSNILSTEEINEITQIEMTIKILGKIPLEEEFEYVDELFYKYKDKK